MRPNVIIAVLCFIPILAGAQVETWGDPVGISSIVSVFDAYESDQASDGVGHHYVLYNPNLNRSTYYRIDNNGNVLNSYQFPIGAHRPAVTAFAGRQHVVLQNGSNLELWRSVDAGFAWTNVGSRLIDGTLYKTDAYEDATGVHIVYMGSNGVFYHLRLLPVDLWSTFPSYVTNDNYNTIGVVATLTHAYVVGPSGLSTLPYSSGTWSEPELIPPSGNFGSAVVQDGSNLHAFPWKLSGEAPPHPEVLYHNYRPISTGSWLVTPTELSNEHNAGAGEWRAQVVVAGEKVRVVYGDPFDDVIYREYSGSTWSVGEHVTNDQSIRDPDVPNISANLTGVSCIWQDEEQSPPTVRFNRRPIGIVGNITENYDFTGNNYVTGYTYIPANVTVRLRSESVTYIADNQRIYVSGSLICEPGGQIVYGVNAEVITEDGGYYDMCETNTFAEGSCTLVRGVVKAPDNTSITFTNGGFLAADGGEFILGDGSSITIANSYESRLDVTQTSTFTFGTNSSLTINGKTKLANGTTVTFPENSHVNVNAGARFEMGNSARLVINGIFSAVGTITNPVVFAPLTEATNWSRIGVSNVYGYSNAEATFSYCQFSGSTQIFKIETPVKFTLQNSTLTSPNTGVQIVPDLEQAPEIPSNRIDILNNTFSSCSGTGISAQSYSNLLIQGNTMTGANTTSTTGIYLYASSPKILSNIISSFNKGISCSNQSSPVLENNATGGNNVIKSNIYGVRCTNGSNAVLGLLTNDPDEGGENSIYNNSTYNVQLSTECIVNAQMNYWEYPVPTTKFSVDGSSSLVYQPYYTYDPNPLEGPLRLPTPDGFTLGSEEGNPFLDPLGDHPMMNEAIGYRIDEEYSAAIAVLRTVLGDENETEEVKAWAVSELLANAMMVQGGNLASYLYELIGDNPTLIDVARNALVTAFVDQQNISSAIATMDYNITNYPNSVLELTGLYGKFSVALFRDNDFNTASIYLDSLIAKYPNSDEAELASANLALAQGDGLERIGSVQLVANNLGTSPLVFRLHQNFPNPFNPTTNIEFELPVDSHVSLKIFDVLGREVLTMVEGDRNAGPHQVVLNGSELSSGVYFYRLKAGDFADTKRLVLLK